MNYKDKQTSIFCDDINLKVKLVRLLSYFCDKICFQTTCMFIFELLSVLSLPI